MDVLRCAGRHWPPVHEYGVNTHRACSWRPDWGHELPLNSPPPSTKEGDDADASDNGAFRILAGYIFGGNRGEESIDMTSPVSVAEGEEIFCGVCGAVLKLTGNAEDDEVDCEEDM